MRTHGNFAGQNKVLESSLIQTIYCITVIDAYYNYTVKRIPVYLLHCLSKTGVFEECDKEKNIEVTGAAATSCLKRKL